MAKTTRWMSWVLDEAQKTDMPMPFARSERALNTAEEKLRKAG